MIYFLHHKIKIMRRHSQRSINAVYIVYMYVKSLICTHIVDDWLLKLMVSPLHEAPLEDYCGCIIKIGGYWMLFQLVQVP